MCWGVAVMHGTFDQRGLPRHRCPALIQVQPRAFKRLPAVPHTILTLNTAPPPLHSTAQHPARLNSRVRPSLPRSYMTNTCSAGRTCNRCRTSRDNILWRPALQSTSGLPARPAHRRRRTRCPPRRIISWGQAGLAARGQGVAGQDAGEGRSPPSSSPTYQ